MTTGGKMGWAQKILLVALFLSATFFANDIIWLKLTIPYSYRDLFTSCTTGPFPAALYFGAEVQAGTVIHANLATEFDTFSSRISFSNKEVASVRLYTDPTKRLWLAGFKLSDRLLFWIFQHAGTTLDQCRPSALLATIYATPFSFIFATEGLGESIFSSSSQMGLFQGKRADGYTYNSSLQFRQQLYIPMN